VPLFDPGTWFLNAFNGIGSVYPSGRGDHDVFVPFNSIKAIPMNRGREKAVWAVIFWFFRNFLSLIGKIWQNSLG
jgi:hypothetical protein